LGIICLTFLVVLIFWAALAGALLCWIGNLVMEYLSALKKTRN
jgi:hypothetical protein